AKDMVLLAAHRILGTPALHRELRFGPAKSEPEMLGQAFHVALVEGDQGVGAAVAWTLLAVVHRLELCRLKTLVDARSISTDWLPRARPRSWPGHVAARQRRGATPTL